MKFKLKKPVKIILIVVGSLVALFLLVAVLISPIAHHYIEKHSKELCNRVVTMDDLRINLFTGTVTIEGFKALEENDKDVFVTFKMLRVNANVWKLISKTVRLTEITLVAPDVVVLQNGDRFNFTDIIEFYKSDEPKEEDDEPSTWVIDLQNITLQDGDAVYRDLAVGSCFKFNDLAVAIPRIYFTNEDTDVGLNLKFDNGGDLTVKMLYALETNSYNLNVKLNKFDISSVEPYVKGFVNLGEFGGKLSTDLNVVGNLDHILEIVADGTIRLQDVFATEAKNEGKTFAKIGDMLVDINKIDVKENVFHFNKIELKGANFIYDIANNGNTLDWLLASDEPSASSDSKETASDTSSQTASSAPMDFVISELSLKNSSFTYNDHTLREPVSIPITNLDFETKNFKMNGPISVKVSAIVAETGQLTANWDGNLADLTNQKIGVLLKNFKLKNISPYSVHYLAHPISDGVLSFADHSSIVNNNIVSNNRLDIYNCVVDKKIKNAPKEFNIPLRAAVYVLADRKGKIAFDLPVQGDLSSPNFSYRKIIFKTLCNFIVKIAAAPIDLILKNLGKSPDTFADILYDIRPNGLGSEADDHLNKIAEVLNEKSELILQVQQSLNWEENRAAYATFAAKMDFCRQMGLTDEALFNAVVATQDRDPHFEEYVDGRLLDNPVVGDIYKKCVALYDVAELDAKINANIERRNQQIISVLSTQGISADRIELMPLGEKTPPKGKTVVSFNVKVKDE